MGFPSHNPLGLYSCVVQYDARRSNDASSAGTQLILTQKLPHYIGLTVVYVRPSVTVVFYGARRYNDGGVCVAQYDARHSVRR